jgi:hypothetical protein
VSFKGKERGLTGWNPAKISGFGRCLPGRVSLDCLLIFLAGAHFTIYGAVSNQTTENLDEKKDYCR